MFDKIPVRLRLSLGHAIWLAIIFSGIGCSLFVIVKRNLYQSVDAALIASAGAIRDAHLSMDSSYPFTTEFLREFFGRDFVRPYAQLVDLSGRIDVLPNSTNSRVSLPVTPHAVSRAELGLETFETITRPNRAPLRQITLPVMRFGRFTGQLIQVGAPLDATYHTLQGISLMLWFALPAGLLLSIFFGYLLTARAFKPVIKVTRAASKLGSDDLGLRLDVPKAKDEIRQLTITFNDMLDRLEEAFQRLQRFSLDVSHELRTPLTVLRGEAEFALRKERTAKEYEESIKTVAQEAKHMTGIVEDLLLLAKTQSKSVALNAEPVDLLKMVNDLKSMVAPVFESFKVNLKIYAEGVIGKSIYASENYLNLSLKNILINAAKHSFKDGDVEFQVDQTTDRTIFKIIDHGEGIPQEAIPYIFDTFYRADTARNRATGGSGVGLSIALALVKMHNGTIDVVSSRQNEGTCFTVSIPQSELQNQEKGQAKEKTKPRELSAVSSQQSAFSTNC